MKKKKTGAKETKGGDTALPADRRENRGAGRLARRRRSRGSGNHQRGATPTWSEAVKWKAVADATGCAVSGRAPASSAPASTYKAAMQVDLRQGRRSLKDPAVPHQRQPRRQHPARHTMCRGRQVMKGVEGAHCAARGVEQIQSQKLMHGGENVFVRGYLNHAAGCHYALPPPGRGESLPRLDRGSAAQERADQRRGVELPQFTPPRRLAYRSARDPPLQRDGKHRIRRAASV